MQTLSRRAVGYAALGVTLAVLFTSPILAQSVSGADPAAFDVSGVRLGMSVNDAIAALKRFEPGYAITKQYWARSPLQYGNIAHDMKELDASDKRVAYLWDLEVEKDEQKQECDYNSYVPEGERETKHCWMEPHAVETVTVWFSPIPGQEMENIKALESFGIGFYPKDISVIKELIMDLKDHPQKLKAMRESISLIRKPDALSNISNAIR